MSLITKQMNDLLELASQQPDTRVWKALHDAALTIEQLSEKVREELIAPDTNVGDKTDCISRQGAIEEMLDLLSNGKDCVDETTIRWHIDSLPSVQPEPCSDHFPEAAKKVEPCGDAISRQAVFKDCTKLYPHLGMLIDPCAVKNLPPVQPERKRGRWIDAMVRDWHCSNCGKGISNRAPFGVINRDELPNFCPNCGADMREDNDEAD